MFLILISGITQQLRHPPAIQPAHALHCISDKQHDIHTYIYTYTYTYTYTYALHCAAMQEASWHGDIIEHVNNGGGEGRSAGQLRIPWYGDFCCASFLDRGSSCADPAGLGDCMPGFQAGSPHSPQPTRGGHRPASTCPPYIRGPTKSHMQQGGNFCCKPRVGRSVSAVARFRLVSYRIATCRVMSCLVVSQLGCCCYCYCCSAVCAVCVCVYVCVLGQVLAGRKHRSSMIFPSWILVLDFDFVSQAAGRVDDNYKFSSPHPAPGLARPASPSLAGKRATWDESTCLTCSLAHPHSHPLHWSANNHVHVHAQVLIPDPVLVHVKVHAPCPCPCPLPVDLHVDLC